MAAVDEMQISAVDLQEPEAEVAQTLQPEDRLDASHDGTARYAQHCGGDS